jgi:hypothetical protein
MSAEGKPSPEDVVNLAWLERVAAEMLAEDGAGSAKPVATDNPVPPAVATRAQSDAVKAVVREALKDGAFKHALKEALKEDARAARRRGSLPRKMTAAAAAALAAGFVVPGIAAAAPGAPPPSGLQPSPPDGYQLARGGGAVAPPPPPPMRPAPQAPRPIYPAPREFGPRPEPTRPPLEGEAPRPVRPFNPPGQDFGPTNPGARPNSFQRDWLNYNWERGRQGIQREMREYQRQLDALQPQDPNAPRQSGPSEIPGLGVTQRQVDAMRQVIERAEPRGYVNQYLPEALRTQLPGDLSRQFDRGRVEDQLRQSFLSDQYNREVRDGFRERFNTAIDDIHNARTVQERDAAIERYNQTARDYNAAELAERDNFGGHTDSSGRTVREVPREMSDPAQAPNAPTQQAPAPAPAPAAEPPVNSPGTNTAPEIPLPQQGDVRGELNPTDGSVQLAGLGSGSDAQIQQQLQQLQDSLKSLDQSNGQSNADLMPLMMMMLQQQQQQQQQQPQAQPEQQPTQPEQQPQQPEQQPEQQLEPQPQSEVQPEQRSIDSGDLVASNDLVGGSGSDSLAGGDGSDSLGGSDDLGSNDLGGSDLGGSGDVGGSDLGGGDLGGGSDLGGGGDFGGGDLGGGGDFGGGGGDAGF